jgi:hypothetical protein
MKTTYPVIALQVYDSFLRTFLFTGLPVPQILVRAYFWPSDEINLRPLIVARSGDTEGNPMRSVVQFHDAWVDNLCRDWEVWKELLVAGHLCAISFRVEAGSLRLTYTISKELGEVWQQYGFAAVAHECPELERVCCTDSSFFRSEVWGHGVVVKAPKPLWQIIIEQDGHWDDRDFYSNL